MNTRFEVLLHGTSEPALRAAGEEALDEIERVEAQLSIFRPASEIARVNRYAAERPVKVSPPTFQLLVLARDLSAGTGGAFDPTVAPLLRVWGFLGGQGTLPDPSSVAAARGCVGMDQVTLDEEEFTVRFSRPGQMLDLGAIGKGYAVDGAVAVLREAGMTSALVHGGTSSVYGLGSMPDGQPWRAAVLAPTPARGPGDPGRLCTAPSDRSDRSDRSDPPDETSPQGILAEVPLSDAALGVSAIAGKAFSAEDGLYGHVLDPATGAPVQRALLAAVALPSATEADALSTALLVLGADGFDVLTTLRPGLRGLVLLPSREAPSRLLIRGLAADPSPLLSHRRTTSGLRHSGMEGDFLNT